MTGHDVPLPGMPDEPAGDEQLELEPAATRRDDPDTSRAAAATVPVKGHAAIVLRLLLAFGNVGALDEQLVAYARRRKITASEQSLRSRRATLVERGLVEECGRATMSTGHDGTLHRLTPAGRELARALPELP